jgi:3-mercaptopyruvate sulfurtransferase SseA
MPARKQQDDPEQVADQAVEEVQATVDAENEQGFIGQRVDPTDRANYTVGGVISGAPTPETDEGAAEEARKSVATPR